MTTQREVDPSEDRIAIDAEELIAALQSHNLELEYLLHRSTGEIVLQSDEGAFGENGEDSKSLIDEYPDRFLIIEPIPSSVGWQTMADFIEQLPPGEVQERLIRAVQLSKPFRRFKDELLNYPDVREDWFAFEYHRMLELARDWLKDEVIEANLKTRENAPPSRE